MTDRVSSAAVAGETLLWTRQGAVAIQSLVDQPVEAWDGQAFVEVTPRLLGVRDDCVELTFRTPDRHRLTITVTDDHAFQVNDDEETVLVRAADLTLATHLASAVAPNGMPLNYLLERRIELDDAQSVYGFDAGHPAVLLSGLPSA